jgi:hypothetical protein
LGGERLCFDGQQSRPQAAEASLRLNIPWRKRRLGRRLLVTQKATPKYWPKIVKNFTIELDRNDVVDDIGSRH